MVKKIIARAGEWRIGSSDGVTLTEYYSADTEDLTRDLAEKIYARLYDDEQIEILDIPGEIESGWVGIGPDELDDRQINPGPAE
jgi:hypothetical protein